MNKILKYGLSALLAVAIFSCCTPPKKDERVRDKATIDSLSQQKVYVWPDSIEMVFLVADSIRTPEQKALARAIQKYRFEHTEVEGQYLVFKVSREEFRETGFPEPYYDFIVTRTNEYNYYLDKWTNMGRDSLIRSWENKKKTYHKELLEEQE